MDLLTSITGPTFTAIWTTVGLGLLWQFNLWPFNNFPQPAKGIVATLVSLALHLRSIV